MWTFACDGALTREIQYSVHQSQARANDHLHARPRMHILDEKRVKVKNPLLGSKTKYEGDWMGEGMIVS